MKLLKSSLLRKIVLGYKITSGQRISRTSKENLRIKPQLPSQIASKPIEPDIQQIAETFKIPAPTIEKIYNATKQIEASLPKEATPEFNAQISRSKIESVEKAAVASGVYLVPQIANSITHAKEKVRELELGATQEINPVSEIKKQTEELERERNVLEEAKKVMMEKYYNREIDESSLKSIMDSYEQRLVETNIRIQNWQKEFEKLEKEVSSGKPKMEKREFLGKLREQSLVPAVAFPAQLPKIVFNLSNLIPPPSRAPRAEQLIPQATEQTPEIETAVQTVKSSRTPQYTSKIEPVKKPPQEMEGIEIPQIPKLAVKLGSLEAEEELHSISLTYPLIPRSPAKNEHVFAYTRIFWDENNNRYVYDLVEPKLTEKLKDVYQKVKEMLEQRLDIDFSKLKKIEAREFLDKQVDDVLKLFKFMVNENEKRILKYYMGRDFTGLEMIEPLMQDPNIEDISCDGVGIPIFVFHRNSEIGSIATNIMFDNEEQLDSFIIRLAQLCGKSISVAEPLLDGTLPDGSRIQATLGTDIARRGSNWTIRKFTEEPLTPVHLMNYGTLDANILAYLWFVVDYGRSILVSGGTASGKTSLLNVLSLFIRPEKKIVSIEDTAELRLPHSHWVPVVARTAISVEGKGEVDMFELLRESLRQRPDYIIVGEVRGKEAYVLFQQMSTGHPSLATIHAENIERLADRLTTPPIALPAGLISILDLVVFLARMKYKNKFTRKVTGIVEIVDFDTDTNTPITNQIYKWDPKTDKFEITNKSISLKKISDFTGINEKDIKNEIERRIVVLQWMKENNIADYRDVHKIFSIYYTDPERLLSAIQGAG